MFFSRRPRFIHKLSPPHVVTSKYLPARFGPLLGPRFGPPLPLGRATPGGEIFLKAQNQLGGKEVPPFFGPLLEPKDLPPRPGGRTQESLFSQKKSGAHKKYPLDRGTTLDLDQGGECPRL